MIRKKSKKDALAMVLFIIILAIAGAVIVIKNNSRVPLRPIEADITYVRPSWAPKTKRATLITFGDEVEFKIDGISYFMECGDMLATNQHAIGPEFHAVYAFDITSPDGTHITGKCSEPKRVKNQENAIIIDDGLRLYYTHQRRVNLLPLY